MFCAGYTTDELLFQIMLPLTASQKKKNKTGTGAMIRKAAFGAIRAIKQAVLETVDTFVNRFEPLHVPQSRRS